MSVLHRPDGRTEIPALPPLSIPCDCRTGYRVDGRHEPVSPRHRDAAPCVDCGGTTRAPNVVEGGACRSCATYPENPPQRAEPGESLCRECGGGE